MIFSAYCLLSGIFHVAVADGEEQQSGLAIVAEIEVGHVPAQLPIDDLAHFRPFGLPLVRRPVGERRQVKAVGADEVIGFANDGVDFRSFHGVHSIGCDVILIGLRLGLAKSCPSTVPSHAI